MVLTGGSLKMFYEKNLKCLDSAEPDDMKLGVWFDKDLNLPAIHFSGFSQRRPQDYPEHQLTSGAFPAPLSFHNIFSQSKDGTLALHIYENDLKGRVLDVEVEKMPRNNEFHPDDASNEEL